MEMKNRAQWPTPDVGATRSAQAVGVISKLPRVGWSKTRLARTLGGEAAIGLHRAFLDDELSQLHHPNDWQLYLIHDLPTSLRSAAEAERLVAGRAHRLVPGQADLAQELRAAFEWLLERHERAAIVSGDVPQVTKEMVERALAALVEADVVLGLGPDGGYYLIAMKEPHDVFTPVTMSTTATVQATLALCAERGLSVATVDRLTDVDEAQDLLVLGRLPAAIAPRTRAFLAGLERGPIAVQPPTELQIEVTSRCNLTCSACLRTHTDLAADADLSLADYREIVVGLPRLERVTFQLNGEPLLNEAVYSMITEARAAGAWTVLNSNGTLLDLRRRTAIIASGLDELRISLDGANRETVAAIAGADVFNKVIRGLRAVVAQRPDPQTPRLSLWMIADRRTFAELPELVRLAADIGVDEVYVQRMVVTGHGSARSENSLHGRVDGAVRAIVAEAEAEAARLGVALRASGRRPILESLSPSVDENPWLACWRPWRSAVVTASRRVLPCCISSFTMDYDSLELGALDVDDWAGVWNGHRYRALRRGLLEGKPIDACARCSREWSL